jgi:hypothetical protein
LREQKNQDDRRCVDQQQADADSGRTLAKDRHDRGIGCVRAGQLHVVGERVGRDALQDELSGIGVFAFVPFQRHGSQVKADSSDEQNYQQERGVVEPGMELVPRRLC